jgi:hypothetical protein
MRELRKVQADIDEMLRKAGRGSDERRPNNARVIPDVVWEDIPSTPEGR